MWSGSSDLLLEFIRTQILLPPPAPSHQFNPLDGSMLPGYFLSYIIYRIYLICLSDPIKLIISMINSKALSLTFSLLLFLFSGGYMFQDLNDQPNTASLLGPQFSRSMLQEPLMPNSGYTLFSP